MGNRSDIIHKLASGDTREGDQLTCVILLGERAKRHGEAPSVRDLEGMGVRTRHIKLEGDKISIRATIPEDGDTLNPSMVRDEILRLAGLAPSDGSDPLHDEALWVITEYMTADGETLETLNRPISNAEAQAVGISKDRLPMKAAHLDSREMTLLLTYLIEEG